MDEQFRAAQLALEQQYLTAGDARGQSGFRGGPGRWERARRVITAPMTADGHFLDIGCANGLLMETVTEWTAARGVAIEPYGLDLSPRLARLARHRLPHWADRVWAGNVIDWSPPRRFEYVRAELDYVPQGKGRRLVQRLLDDYLEPGGVAILCSYGSARRRSPVVYDIGELVGSWGFEVGGEAAATDLNGAAITRVCWVTKK